MEKACIGFAAEAILLIEGRAQRLFERVKDGSLTKESWNDSIAVREFMEAIKDATERLESEWLKFFTAHAFDIPQDKESAVAEVTCPVCGLPGKIKAERYKNSASTGKRLFWCSGGNHRHSGYDFNATFSNREPRADPVESA